MAVMIHGLQITAIEAAILVGGAVICFTAALASASLYRIRVNYRDPLRFPRFGGDDKDPPAYSGARR